MAAYVLIALSAAYLVAILTTFAAICIPFEANWGHVPGGHCGNEFLPYVLSGVFNLLLDISIIILPMPQLWALQLPVSKKVALSAVFGTGIV